MTVEEAISVLKNRKNKPQLMTVNELDALDLLIRRGEALKEVKEEIKQWYWDADKQALRKDPCVVDSMVDLFVRTIDKYLSEVENDNNYM